MKIVRILVYEADECTLKEHLAQRHVVGMVDHLMVGMVIKEYYLTDNVPIVTDFPDHLSVGE